ncbi:MAG: sigma 54-interacting transcriptional regulator [Acidobacteria bacterium]|nr:sigma 54-interacting transcriptional regulator [Acidobacteriota bacterium]
MHSGPIGDEGQAEHYRALLKINNALISGLTQHSLLSSVSNALRSVVEFDAVALMLYLPEQNTFRILALEGITRHFHVGQEIGRADSSVGWVFDHKRYILRRNLATELQYENERRLLDEGMRSHCVVPLIVRGESIGTLNLASKKDHQYSEKDASFLQEVAAQVALAVQNMKAYEEIATLNAKISRSAQQTRTLLEINNAIVTKLTKDELLHAICQAMKRAVRFDEIALVLHEPDADLLRVVALEGSFSSAHFKVGSAVNQGGISRWVFDQRRIALRGDLEQEAQTFPEKRAFKEGVRSLCALPLIVHDRPIGVLSIASALPNQYAEEDVGFLREVANQVAIAVANMESHEEIASLNAQVSRTAEQTRTLLEINNAIVTKLTQDELLHAICEATKRAVPFDEVGLILHETESDILRVVAIECTIPSEYFKVGYALDRDGPAGWAFDQRHLFLRKDLEHDAQTATERRVLGEGIRSICALPLIVHERCLGVLSVCSVTRNQYSEENAAFLQEVANQVAIAVSNMKSHEEVAALNRKVALAAERSRTLLAINNAVITSLSREALLQSTSSVLRGVIQFDRCAFTIYQPQKDNFRFLTMDSEVQSDYFRPGLEFERNDSVAGRVHHELRGALRRDLEKEQQYFNDRRLLAEGIRSYCVVPMVAGGRCIGTLNVGSKAKNQYSEQDAEFLQEVATQVALAVENMQAFEEISALKTRVEAENVYLQEEILREHNFDEIVGNSPALLDLLRNVEVIAPTDASVLLYGETGTGKELLARAIHSRSRRSARAMVTVNCGAIPSGLVESELFGHVKGAFTGALQNSIGRFELADGSTLFLDEVGELPAETQVKLLRVLQEHEFQPVGSSRTKKVDVRTIAATNRNLQEDVRAGRFRSDLFYRLNVLPLRVPALRERRVDVPELVLFFLERACHKFGRKIMSVSQETMKHLVAYEWPGNIRELQNVIERGVVLCRGSVLAMGSDLLPVADRPSVLTESPAPDIPSKPLESSNHPHQSSIARTLEAIEKEHILRVLDSTGGIIDGPKGAAQILALHPSTLRARMKKLHIRRSAH